MGNHFYLKLAFNNVKRNQRKMVPYFIAATIIISIYFVVNVIVYTPGMKNVPESVSLQNMFKIGIYTLNIFIAIFMLYINSFLIKQRKKELGLYGILGLEKRHVGHVLLWENIIVNGVSVILGILSGCVFGWLIFMMLMKSIHVTSNSYFAIPSEAIINTLIYFFIIFFITSIFNLLQIRLANPIDLLKSDHQGEKKSRFLIPITLIGLVTLGYAYYLALTVTNPLIAMNQFFIAVLLVIVATYMLFISGSIFFLKFLKKNKLYYYKPENFISVSGMLHRMKQNASGLASICILSTMVLVTVSTCVALFLGQEDILKINNENDIKIAVEANTSNEQMSKLEALFKKAADDNKVEIEQEYHYYSNNFMQMHKNGDLLAIKKGTGAYYESFMDYVVDVTVITLSDYNRTCKSNDTLQDNQIIMLSDKKYNDVNHYNATTNKGKESFEVIAHKDNTVFTNGKNKKSTDEIFLVVKDKAVAKQIAAYKASDSIKYILNVKGNDENCIKFSDQIDKEYIKIVESGSFDSIFSSRVSGYSLYGGLLFMGAFFTILFLCATVLIIYFKQISEGYEDKDRFTMLQKVGMDEREVKRTINKQIRIVFFLPLLGALLHLGVASHMIIKLLEVFMLYNVKLTVLCMVGSSAVFTVVYILVYSLTAKTYCRIVKW